MRERNVGLRACEGDVFVCARALTQTHIYIYIYTLIRNPYVQNLWTIPSLYGNDDDDDET